VVDDQAENRHFLIQLLQMVGFKTFEAENGRIALAKFKAERPDLVLMDMHMPVMDGYEATRRLKASETGQSTPVIAVSASVFKEQRKEMLNCGVDAVLLKPFREDELFALIQAHLHVEFVREEAAVDMVPDTPDNELTPADLADLPLKLREAMREAALLGNIDSLRTQIEQINERTPQVVPRLRQMVDRFDYEQLLGLLEET